MTNERVAAWLDATLRHRLWFAESDAHDTASLPFALCRRHDLVTVGNVACGTIGPSEIRLFDLEVWIETGEHGDASGPSVLADLIGEALSDTVIPGHLRIERWECAIVRAGAECARLSVAPEGVLTRLADMVSFGDQDLELEAFNRMFEVQTTDRGFASAFLDARMAEYLCTSAAGCVIETVGNRILVAQAAGDPPDVDVLIERVLGVAGRVPNAVRALAPALPAAALSPRCPIGPDGRPRVVTAPSTADDDDGRWVHDPGGWAGPRLARPGRPDARSRGRLNAAPLDRRDPAPCGSGSCSGCWWCSPPSAPSSRTTASSPRRT